MDLLDFQRKLKRLSLDELINRAVLDNKEEILDLNTAQLSKGKDSFDRFLEEYVSDAYAKFKKALGGQAPLGIPDLKLEGDFYEGFTLIVEGQDYRVTSTDDKTDRLVEKYGQEIFALSEESLQEIRPQILESLLKFTRNELFR